MTRDRVTWTLLIIWAGAVSAAVVRWTDASPWFVAAVLVYWLVILVVFWPEEAA